MTNNNLNLNHRDMSYSTNKLMDARNSGFVNSMIVLFIKTANEFIEDIMVAKTDEDIIRIQHLAHRLKASVDILDIKSVTTVVREIEASQEYNVDLENKISITIQNLELVIDQMKIDFGI